MRIAVRVIVKPMPFSCQPFGSTSATNLLNAAISMRAGCPGYWAERSCPSANHSIPQATTQSFKLMRAPQKRRFPRFSDEDGQIIADATRFAAGGCHRWCRAKSSLARRFDLAQCGDVAGNPLQRVSLCSHRKGPKPFPRRTVRNQRLCAVRRYGAHCPCFRLERRRA